MNDNIGDMAAIVKAAVNIGLDEAGFLRAFQSPQTVAAVESDLMLARQYQIRSIPTLVINGEKVVSNTLTADQLNELIDG